MIDTLAEYLEDYQIYFDKATITGHLVTQFFNYNEEVSIDLPEEALDAIEMSDFM